MPSRRFANKLTATAAALLAVVLAVLAYGSFYMLEVSLGDLSGKDVPARRALLGEESPDVLAWADSLKSMDIMRDTFMTTHDGRRLHAVFASAPYNTRRTIVVIHGYTCNVYSSMKIARMFRDSLHLNIFMPDLHGHGLSDGDEVQMGWKDADDLLEWMPLITHLFCDSDSARIAVQGVSMGAATAMNLSGKEDIPQIKCYIEDCGYTSVWDEFSHELKGRYGLPAFPLMHSTSLLCKLRYGWSFREASPVDMVRLCDKPMLFIHGDSDDFVPSWMVHPLYQAKRPPKSLWVPQGTDHAHSFRDYPQEYAQRVKAFLSSSGMPEEKTAIPSIPQ